MFAGSRLYTTSWICSRMLILRRLALGKEEGVISLTLDIIINLLVWIRSNTSFNWFPVFLRRWVRDWSLWRMMKFGLEEASTTGNSPKDPAQDFVTAGGCSSFEDEWRRRYNLKVERRSRWRWPFSTSNSLWRVLQYSECQTLSLWPSCRCVVVSSFEFFLWQ